MIYDNLSMIVACDENNGIGLDNNLLVNLPIDMKRFIKITSGKMIIMGRKTFDSIPNKPLKNRINVVLTRSNEYIHRDIIVINSKNDAINLIKDSNKEVIIIGGSEIYDLFYDNCKTIYMTMIHHIFESNKFFNCYKLSDFYVKDYKFNAKDENNKHDCSFITYERLKK